LASDAERAIKDGLQPAALPGGAAAWLGPLKEEARTSCEGLGQVVVALQRRQAAPPQPAATTDPVADWRPVWGSRLQELAVLLEASDMQALELHDQMLQDAGLASAPEWSPLHEAMEKLDFEQALAAARQLIDT
jgi:hypothetical protein